MTDPAACLIGNYCDITDRDVTVDCTDSAGDGTNVNTCMTPCPAGTYNNVAYAASEAECLACPAGKYCEE
jgi:hypothetical protein